MTQTPRIRYHLTVPRTQGTTVLDAPDVIAWVRGYAAALGQSARLDVVDFTAAEDTVRVQILQVGEAASWFRYMFQTRDDDSDTAAVAETAIVKWIGTAGRRCGASTSDVDAPNRTVTVTVATQEALNRWAQLLDVAPEGGTLSAQVMGWTVVVE